ncbi:hypothetical protein GCM10027048_09720 [Hymenobacter coalescens]
MKGVGIGKQITGNRRKNRPEGGTAPPRARRSAAGRPAGEELTARLLGAGWFGNLLTSRRIYGYGAATMAGSAYESSIMPFTCLYLLL